VRRRFEKIDQIVGKTRELEDFLTPFSFPAAHDDLSVITDVIADLIIQPFAPQCPIISPTDTIACFGSCFAENMGKALASQGRNVSSIYLDENLNTAFAVNHFVHFALESQLLQDGYLPENFSFSEDSHAQMRRSNAFIITFGLAACWHEKATGKRIMEIPGGVNRTNWLDKFSAHEMRLSTVDENVEQIDQIIECIRRKKPDAPIILTLSPIPLARAFMDTSPITANLQSKATLLLAIHKTMSKNLPDVFYWPAYEIVEWLGRHDPIWGRNEKSLRHPDPGVITSIMDAFSRLYVMPAATRP
jgi:hypothetical protein